MNRISFDLECFDHTVPREQWKRGDAWVFWSGQARKLYEACQGIGMFSDEAQLMPVLFPSVAQAARKSGARYLKKERDLELLANAHCRLITWQSFAFASTLLGKKNPIGTFEDYSAKMKAEDRK